MGSQTDAVADDARGGSLDPADPAYAFDLFIAHAAADAEFVRGFLLPALNLAASRVLLLEDLPASEAIVPALDRTVSRSRFTVAVLSPAYLVDRWAVFGEQLASYLSVDDARIIPLRLLDCQLPLHLDARVSLDFRDPTGWELAAKRLRDLLHTPAPAAEPLACPYPGMQPFTANEAPQFFGRDAEIDDLVGRLARGEREIYVIGPSGSGKSSLVQAGLLPVMDAGGSKLLRSFVTRTMRPGERPAGRLAKLLEGELAVSAGSPATVLGAALGAVPEAALGAVPEAALGAVPEAAVGVGREAAVGAGREAAPGAGREAAVGAGREAAVGAGREAAVGAGREAAVGAVPEVAPGPAPGALGIAITALLARHAPAERVLVFVDQLEELFTVADPAERQRFIAALQGLRAEPRCYLLLALRADFYGALMDSALWPAQGAQASLARLEVAPLRGAALAKAITAPAARVGVHLETRLCDRLVADAAEEPGVLPLLQETLRLLWDKRRRRLLELAAYEALGDGGRGLYVAIARRADAAMATLTDAQQVIARRVLLRLVSFGEGRLDTRRQQELPALRSAADDAGAFSQVVQRLVDDRLITVGDAEDDHDVLVDLSHEALITAWPALREWIARRRIDEQRRRRLEAKVGDWIERGRGTARLLDPVELAEAARWMASDTARELGYGAELSALVAASRAELARAERQRRRRTLRAIAVLAVFSAVASILGVVAWLQRREARDKTVIAQRSQTDAEHKTAEVEHLLGMTYLERGRVLLLDGHPMQALPYLVEARNQHIESPVLQMLFAQASRDVPQVTLIGHHGSVLAAAFSPDGTRVITSSWDHTARVWNAATGAPVTAPLVHKDTVHAVAFSADGSRVVTASEDGTARVWDARTGAPVTGPLTHDGVVCSAAFSPDGARVVTASEDGAARVWDAGTGAVVAGPFEHQGAVLSAVFSADGTRVVTASADGTARVWNVATGAAVAGPLAHDDTVRTAVFSPDGTRVVTASWDGTARVWDATTGTAVTGPLQHDNVVVRAVFSPDGTRVVTASHDGTARVWNAVTGAAVARLVHGGPVYAAAFSRDGTRLVTASEDATARLWDASTGKPIRAALEHRAAVNDAVFSPDGTRVVTASWDQAARIWDATPDPLAMASIEHQAEIMAAAFSPDGTRVVTASSDQTARVWRAATGAPVTGPLEHDGFVGRAAFSPDGTRVITASGAAARIWNATTGEPVTAWLQHQRTIMSVAFSPDGARVVTASLDTTARIWDAATGKSLVTLEHPSFVNAAVFSPDGTRVGTAGEDSAARIWDAATGAVVVPLLKHENAVVVVAFSPDGTRVLTASADRTARLWSAATGAPVTEPFVHGQIVESAVFSADGTRVVTASRDTTARVWDATTGHPVTAPLPHGGYVRTAAFSADGTRVITASSDGARVWDAATGNPVMPQLRQPDGVRVAAFSPDGSQVVTASNETAQVWTLAMDHRPLEDWQRLGLCSPFAVVNNVLVANPAPRPVCAAPP